MKSYSKRVDCVKSSAIRELLKLTEKVDIISFAGGLPAGELFPIKELKQINARVLDEDGKSALQYNTTEGLLKLREQLSQKMQEYEIKSTINNILITNGAQQGLDLFAKLFLDKNDVVITENPSYIGAINIFKAYEANLIPADTDDNGINPDSVEQILIHNPKVKFIYTIPDFQNPMGISLSLARKEQLVKLANKYDVYILEDSPYIDIKFTDEKIVPLQAFDTEDRVMYLGTFSKILCPGMRLAWMHGSEELIQKCTILKQGTDLQCSSISQREVSLYIEQYGLTNLISQITKTYLERKNAMIEAIYEYFPKNVKITNPKGGLFLWVELPENIDSLKLFSKALEHKVSFVPGVYFFPNEDKHNFFRMNFSNMPIVKIIEGVKILAKVIEEEIR